MNPCRLLLILTALLLAGCADRTYWAVRTVPTTDRERADVAEQVRLMMLATPRTLAGHDQDWDDAIRAATESACASLCRPTLWEHSGYQVWTGRWHYLDEPQTATKAKSL